MKYQIINKRQIILFLILLVFTFDLLFLFQNFSDYQNNRNVILRRCKEYNLEDLKVSEEFQDFEWANEYSGLSEAIAEDSTGNIYLLVKSSGNRTLVKYSSEGSLIWNKTLMNIGTEMIIDSSNNIYITGTNNFDMYLLKYDINGNNEWQYSWDSGLRDYIRDIALDSQGNVYIAGEANRNSSIVGSGDMVVLKYNSTGHLLLNKTWGKKNLEDQAQSVVIDSNGNIYMGGYYENGGSIWELIKLDPLGDYQWNYTCDWNGSGGVCKDLAVDSDDNIYLTGYYNMDIGLIKLNILGEHQWNTTWDGGLLDLALSIAIDSQDKIFIAGYTYTGDPDDDYDALFLKYDIDGNQVWNTTWERIFEDIFAGYYHDSFSEIHISHVDNDIYLSGTSEVGVSINNATLVKYENTPPIPPDSFTLSTDADSPDKDGLFDLIWTDSEGADNYSVYVYDDFIIEINESLTLLANQTASSPHSISGLSNGNYYYIIVAYNEFGMTSSNCIEIIVEIQESDQGTKAIYGYNIMFIVSSICILSIYLLHKKCKKLV